MLFGLKKFVSFWLMPLPFCLSLLIVATWLILRARRPRLGRAVLVAALSLLFCFSNAFVSSALIKPLEARYPAIPELRTGEPLPANLAACRFVVVLGGGNHYTPGLAASHRLSSSALARLTEAVRLLRLLPDAKLIVSGPGERKDLPAHAVVLAQAAISLGIDERRIMLVDRARDTEDESRMIGEHLGGAPFALVTSARHMSRSVALFRSAGLEPLPCPADYKSQNDGVFRWGSLGCDVASLERSTMAVRERLGYLWIRLRGKA